MDINTQRTIRKLQGILPNVSYKTAAKVAQSWQAAPKQDIPKENHAKPHSPEKLKAYAFQLLGQ